ncbi:MAG TPA: aldehyde dehydrogenase family protein [Steroidobacteraceae bacterium]|nr:aldehyde dehydrogenase family protein [Steroidobacteraceae bacterium]
MATSAQSAATPGTGFRHMYVNGKWTDASDGATLDVINPATEAVLSKVAAGSAKDVDAAVKAARAQFDGGEWSKMPGSQRARLLNRLADLLERDKEYLAKLESANVGKPLFEPTMLDIPMTIDTVRYFAGWADKIEGRTIPTAGVFGRPAFSYTVREPVGVVGAITPWNAPTMIAAWKFAPALAAGCTMVMKPSEEAPLSTLHIAKLMEEAGIPAGVFNVVPGVGEIAGAAIARHPGIDKISFTGSPEVGREIQKVAADTFKRVTLELGGKTPHIVLADADLNGAIGGVAMGLFANSGQICAAGTRVFVHRSNYEKVLDGLAGAAASVKQGDPFSPDTNMGTLISRKQLERVSGYVKLGVGEGAKVVAGGDRLGAKGFFFKPTILSGVNNDMRIAQEEIFGPVGAIMPFDDVEEAVRLANATRYGLSACVWTRDINAAHSIAARVRAGTVWINSWGAIDPRLPWGGFKSSGIGRELGFRGLEACTEEKVVSVVM